MDFWGMFAAVCAGNLLYDAVVWVITRKGGK